MGSSNSESIWQLNESMAKEYCDLGKEHGHVSCWTQPLKLVEYYSEEENSFYLVVFVITGYLALIYHWSMMKITQSGVHVARAFATLILMYSCSFFSLLWKLRDHIHLWRWSNHHVCMYLSVHIHCVYMCMHLYSYKHI